MNNRFTPSRGLAVRLLCSGFAISILLSNLALARAPGVTFPDPNLEAAVRDSLQIFSPNNIYQTNLSSPTFTNFSANSRGILDLTGLQYATNLTRLEVRGAFGPPGVTDFSIPASFRKLTYLDVSGNRATNGSP